MDEKKKKKAYVKPEMRIEEFAPNEYVGACFKVKCNVIGDDEDAYQTWNNYHVTHGPGGCNLEANQYIMQLANKMWKVKEINSDQGDDLKTNFTPISNPEDYTAERSLSWNTENKKDGRVWHHHGQVIMSGKSNHS